MTRKAWVIELVTAALAVGALATAIVTVRREFSGTPGSARRQRASVEPNWQQYATTGHVLGNSKGPVTIVEFADFQCPFCQRFSRYVDSLEALGRSIRVVYRHLPSPAHAHALAAVRASECAAVDGGFQRMHRVMTMYSDSIGVAHWSWFAKEAHIGDSVRFMRCVTSTSAIPSLARDTADARKLRITGTPTLLVQDQRYDGLPPFDSLLAYVDRARSKRP